MSIKKRVEIFGDSILKGIQINPKNMRYHVDNNIDIELIEKRHLLSIINFSKFGCTVTKGLALLEKRLKGNKPSCDAILMDFGGNDCDFNWKEISECPDDEHLPHTPLNVFVDTYHKIIALLSENGIRPIMTTLPPLDANKFFNWYCNGLNKPNVLKWLGNIDLIVRWQGSCSKAVEKITGGANAPENIDVIYRWQESYSKAIEKIAAGTNTLLVDLRGAFLRHSSPEHLLCEDGTHPNTEGQKIITQTFLEFIENAKIKGEIMI
ncbi:MAG: SGNH/GDSL hydrolase family protein [Oscillospiraceae bacterium]|nr:SGNH/GDSL hydrolase family protein [Oscillospiraceae bacterium]